MALTTGAGLLIVALDILLDDPRRTSMADRVWAQSAVLSGSLLFVAGIVTLLLVSIRNRAARFFAIAIFLASIGAGAWGVSAGVDLLCVKQRASSPSPTAVLTARISIAASAVSGWVGLMGMLAVASLRTQEKSPIADDPPLPDHST